MNFEHLFMSFLLRPLFDRIWKLLKRYSFIKCCFFMFIFGYHNSIQDEVQSFKFNKDVIPYSTQSTTENIQVRQRVIKQQTHKEKILSSCQKLMRVIENNNFKKTKKLISSKNINCQDKYGNTPLHKLAQAGDITLIKELLNYGAMMEIQNKEGNTFLHTVACNWNKNDVEDIVWHLYENRKENLQKIINIRNHQGNTILHLINIAQAYFTSDMLMEIGADDSIPNYRGYTPHNLRLYLGKYFNLSKKCQVNFRDS